MLYAFCGYNIYNIFFFFFLDSAALFPYMLAALDDAVLDGRRGALPVLGRAQPADQLFLLCRAGRVFAALFFSAWCAGRVYRLTPRTFGRLAFETLLGCAAGCVLLIPAGLSLLQNPRTIDPFDGYGYLIYGKAQQYLAILFSAFLMPDAPYLTDLFSEGVTKWTSLSAYLPVVGLAGGIAFCRVWRRHPFARLLKICALCAFVPALNSLFYALNSSYYARWYYMPLLVLVRGHLPGAAARKPAPHTRSAAPCAWCWASRWPRRRLRSCLLRMTRARSASAWSTTSCASGRCLWSACSAAR